MTKENWYVLGTFIASFTVVIVFVVYLVSMWDWVMAGSGVGEHGWWQGYMQGSFVFSTFLAKILFRHDLRLRCLEYGASMPYYIGWIIGIGVSTHSILRSARRAKRKIGRA